MFQLEEAMEVDEVVNQENPRDTHAAHAVGKRQFSDMANVPLQNMQNKVSKDRHYFIWLGC